MLMDKINPILTASSVRYIEEKVCFFAYTLGAVSSWFGPPGPLPGPVPFPSAASTSEKRKPSDAEVVIAWEMERLSSEPRQPAVQACGGPRQPSTSNWLQISYQCGIVKKSIKIDWRPDTFEELSELARKVFPIPSSVGLVMVDETTHVDFTTSTWERDRLITEKIYVAPLADGPPNETFPVYQIIVKTLTGRRFPVTVTETDTTARIYLEASRHEGIPLDQIRLIFEGRQLALGETVRQHNLRPNDSILLVLRLRGGKPVIYVFSRGPKEVQVALSLVPSWSFSTVYPIKPVKKSDEGETIEWSVVTKEDGTLFDLDTRSDVAYLYWEALTNLSFQDGITPPHSRPSTPSLEPPTETFVPIRPVLNPQNAVIFPVTHVPTYMNETLLVLGLHTEARTSFITYWLPDMLKHPNIAIRFVPQIAYEKAAPLNIQPRPTITTRVFMLWCGVSTNDAGENGPWAEAMLRGKTMEITKWREIVGTTGAMLKDEGDGLRVLEWGGMEVK
ncbi:hypothetical protein FRC18_010710 [Serendipita sp. 400]|nr:hypothetical protein FRC18_010710 [Serendipita sp. 400]